MDKSLAKSLLTPGKNTLTIDHGTVWFENHSEDGRPVLEPYRSIDLVKKYISKTGHKIVVVKEKAPRFFVYGSYQDLETFECRTKLVDNLYEVILSEHPRFLYTDFEWTLGMDESDIVIDANINVILDFIKDEYNIELLAPLCQVSVSDGTNNTSKTWGKLKKGSAHVKFPVIFRNAEDMKTFMEQLENFVITKATTTKNLTYQMNGNEKMVLDMSVYGKNKNMRMLNNSKFGETRPLVPHRGGTGVLDHLVCVYNPQDFSDFPVIEIRESEGSSASEKARTRVRPKKPELGKTDFDAFDQEPVPLELLEGALDCLSDKRLQDYMTWIQVIWAISNICKSSGLDDEEERLMHKYSTKCIDKYSKEEVNRKYDVSRLIPSGVKLGSLLFWAMTDSPERYKLLVSQNAQNRLFRKAVRQNLYIDTSTLHPSTTVIEYNDRFVQPYDLVHYDIIAVNSGLNTGKTFQMGKLVASRQYPRVVVFSNRILFGIDIMKNLNEAVENVFGCQAVEYHFQSHLEFIDKPIPKETRRIVIQMESVHKLEFHDFDLVILDESEAALAQFSARTMSNLRKCSEQFYRICRDTPKMIVCDGFLTKRTTNVLDAVIEQTGKTCLLHVNHHILMDKTAIEISSRHEFIEAIIQVLERNQRPVLFTSSKRVGDDILEKVHEHFKLDAGGSKINARYYNADGDDRRMLEDMADVDRSWSKLDCLMFSPVITNGVNFTAQHFQCVFLYGTASSCCVSQVMQAARRVRNISQNRFYFHINSVYYGTDNTSWSYRTVATELTENGELQTKYCQNDQERLLTKEAAEKDIKLQFADEMLKFASGNSGQDLESVMDRVQCLRSTMNLVKDFESCPAWLFDVMVRNRIEVNLSHSRYEDIFKDYLQRIGVAKITQYQPQILCEEAAADSSLFGREIDDDVFEYKYDKIPSITPQLANLYIHKEQHIDAPVVSRSRL